MRSRTLLITALAGAALALPSAASAGTVIADNGTYTYTAADGQVDNFGLQPGYDDDTVVRLYTGSNPITSAPAECDDHAVDYGYIECPVPSALVVNLGDGKDSYGTSLDVPAGIKITVDGGPGDDWLQGDRQDDTLLGGDGTDRLEGNAGNDRIEGGAGDDELNGYSGSDTLLGGDGNDNLKPDYYEEPSADVVDGGAGIDTIDSDYSSRFSDLDPPVAITLGGGADDGRPGEGDDLRGVERLVLSVGGKVVGSDAGEYVKLHQVGDDGVLIGNGGDDELRGGDGTDQIDGGTGDDKLDGGFGDDTITGGPGRDQISADLAGGDCGPLWCKYPFGNDVVDARDGEADSVSCGVGADKVLADAVDTVSPDCEQVERSGAVDTPVTPDDGPVGPGPAPVTARVKLAGADKLRIALKRGLKLTIAGAPKGAKVKALSGRRTVGRGVAKTGGKVTVRFTKAARRSLARRRSVRLTIVAPGVREAVTVKR